MNNSTESSIGEKIRDLVLFIVAVGNFFALFFLIGASAADQLGHAPILLHAGVTTGVTGVLGMFAISHYLNTHWPPTTAKIHERQNEDGSITITIGG